MRWITVATNLSQVISASEFNEIMVAISQAPLSCGQSTVIAIDGPAGSGKTSLASRISEQLAAMDKSSATIHMDDLYHGWSDALGATLTQKIEQSVIPGLASGQVYHLPRFDWNEGKEGGLRTYLPSEIVLIEGVGAGQRSLRNCEALLIWIEVPDELGLERVLSRDGSEISALVEQFQIDQAAHFLQEGTAQAAEFRLNGAP